MEKDESKEKAQCGLGFVEMALNRDGKSTELLTSNLSFSLCFLSSFSLTLTYYFFFFFFYCFNNFVSYTGYITVIFHCDHSIIFSLHRYNFSFLSSNPRHHPVSFFHFFFFVFFSSFFFYSLYVSRRDVSIPKYHDINIPSNSKK